MSNFRSTFRYNFLTVSLRIWIDFNYNCRTEKKWLLCGKNIDLFRIFWSTLPTFFWNNYFLTLNLERVLTKIMSFLEKKPKGWYVQQDFPGFHKTKINFWSIYLSFSRLTTSTLLDPIERTILNEIIWNNKFNNWMAMEIVWNK
jgi:hypothetical protein